MTSQRLTLYFVDAARFAQANGTMNLFEAMKPALLAFAQLLDCNETKPSGRWARGIEYLRDGRILFVFFVERLRADLPGVCALNIDTSKFAPHLATELDKLIGRLQGHMPVTVPNDGTYRFPSIGFKTAEEGALAFSELSRLMRFAIDKHGPHCFGPRATWVKVDEWNADPVTDLEPASNSETVQDAEAGQSPGPVPVQGEAIAHDDHSSRASDSDPGNPPPDVDEWVWRQICERRGQQAFRRNLLAAYERQCAITKCRVEAALEAAHLTPHSEETNYEVTNGILLRADVHTLFDLHLVSIDPDTMLVRLHPTLLESYDGLDSKPVHLPAAAAQNPDAQRLRDHFEQWRLVAGVETEPSGSPL